MLNVHRFARLLPAVAVLLFAQEVRAQSFRVQCPVGTVLHPADPSKDSSVAPVDRAKYSTFTLPGRTDGLLNPTLAMAHPGIKCQQLSGGDGFATMGDGQQTYLFSFGPLSGLSNIVNGKPGTVTALEFNQSNVDSKGNVNPAVKIGAPDGPAYAFNGAIGLVPDLEGSGSGAALQAIVLNASVDSIVVTSPGSGYVNPTVTMTSPPCVIDGTTCVQATATATTNATTGGISSVTIVNPGNGYGSPPAVAVLGPAVINGHVDPRLVMDVGVMNGNIPAPLIAIDEGDELFLTLTNVGMIMRPDLFEQHTVHFHGYANASAFYDGVPDASVSISIGGSFTYYYLAPEAGTYMWHCHISPPEHLQMGMVGQLYVRPKQNSVAAATDLKAALQAANQASATSGAGIGCNDILCAGQTPLPVVVPAVNNGGGKYAYNDGDGSTAYDVEYPIQLHGFDPNFHFVGMTFNPESFVDNKDKYFLLNGRSYPDTINPAPLSTQATDGTPHFSQPLPSLIQIPRGGKALLRFSDLNVTEYHTLASLGIPMHVIAVNARLLRDLDGNNMYYDTNSITIAGGESIDVILDASDTARYPSGSTFYLYTPQLDHLSNDAENFGGMMTEVVVN